MSIRASVIGGRLVLNQPTALPEGTVPTALIPIGYPDANFGPVKRKPVEEVTHWERWGEARAK